MSDEARRSALSQLRGGFGLGATPWKARKGMGVVATLSEGASIAFDALRLWKVRSGLTILGVTIGVLVVMVMAAVIQGVNNSFGELLSGRGATTFYVAHARLEMTPSSGLEEEQQDFWRREPVDPAFARELRRLPGITSASVVADLSFIPYEARWASRDVGVVVAAVGSDFMEIDNGDIVDGRFFTAVEEERRTPVAVIDVNVAEDLFQGLDPIGRTIRIQEIDRGSAAFRVIGIYEAPDNLFAGIYTHYVLVPFRSADKYLNVWDRGVSLIVRPQRDTELSDAVDRVHARMRQLRGLKPGEADDFVVLTQNEIMSLWNSLTSVLFTVMVALSSVGLLVGGVGVIGIMLISVTERTREIGVRKSMGARRRDILWQFLVEAATLTVVGGAGGLLLGGGIVWMLNAWTPVPASVPLWSIFAALAASALTGIGFGMYPATRAARMNPVDALRYE
jgi:putative ABC transport system permease protein